MLVKINMVAVGVPIISKLSRCLISEKARCVVLEVNQLQENHRGLRVHGICLIKIIISL